MPRQTRETPQEQAAFPSFTDSLYPISMEEHNAHAGLRPLPKPITFPVPHNPHAGEFNFAAMCFALQSTPPDSTKSRTPFWLHQSDVLPLFHNTARGAALWRYPNVPESVSVYEDIALYTSQGVPSELFTTLRRDFLRHWAGTPDPAVIFVPADLRKELDVLCALALVEYLATEPFLRNICLRNTWLSEILKDILAEKFEADKHSLEHPPTRKVWPLNCLVKADVLTKGLSMTKDVDSDLEKVKGVWDTWMRICDSFVVLCVVGCAPAARKRWKSDDFHYGYEGHR